MNQTLQGQVVEAAGQNQLELRAEPLNLATATLAAQYLVQFGFLAWDVAHRVDPNAFQNALKAFQGFFDLPQTGALTSPDLNIMATPRCGVPDMVDPTNPAHAHFVALPQFAQQNLSRWQKKGLKYYIGTYVKSLGKSDQVAIHAGIWKAWDGVCGIHAERTLTSNDADVIIGAGRGRTSGFDGPGRILAWAELPPGDDRQLRLMFDDDETFVASANQRGILLFNTGCHEVGHNLGLGHSNVSTALMAPTYNPGVAVPQWNDDIQRVIARYGEDVPATEPPKPDPQPGATDYVINVRGELRIPGYRLVRE